MKNFTLLLLSLILLACNENTKDADSQTTETSEDQSTETVAPVRVFPKSIGPLFETHGGVAKWEKMNSLYFEIEKASGVEAHSTDLKSRKALIEHENWKIGFDGSEVWLAQDSTYYKGNARFYHNLYFYFYAMPFIVSDPGISYQQMGEAMEIEGKKYLGTHISYKDDVGDSPEDQYIIYRDPETGQMAWLAYTVTYSEQINNKEFSYIKYGEWQEVNGLVLPKAITWYSVEDGKPVAPRNTVTFNKVSISDTALDQSMFSKPEGAEVVPR